MRKITYNLSFFGECYWWKREDKDHIIDIDFKFDEKLIHVNCRECGTINLFYLSETE